jgi:hypothetical protein
MNKRNNALTLAALVILASVSLTASAFAQDNSPQAPRPMFAHPAPHRGPFEIPSTSLQTWQGTFNFVGDGGNQTITEVGTNPSSTNTTTTIPVVIIPIEFVVKKGTVTRRFSAEHVLTNGNTVVQNTINSPIFSTGIDFVQGGTDLGVTQYEDAYQRGNFWTDVMTNTNYHLLLGSPTVTAVQVIHVPTSLGSFARNPFGSGQVGLVDINFFDGAVQGLLTSLGITPNELPIFEYYDTYLTEGGGCCIGGYHSANGNGQTYSTFAYVDSVGAFSQDVSALSHEIGEWVVDPLISNSACGGLMEVGDPLEGENNYGGYPYTLNGFTYNLQDLVFLKYFGQSPATSVNGWETFQGTTLSTCQNGQ